MSNEGVSSDSGRWIKLERAGLKKRKRERERERGRGMAHRRLGEEYGGHHGRPPEARWSRADGELQCTVFDSKSTRREESDASPFPTISAVGEAVSAEVHGGAMNDPPELAGRTPEATVSHGKKPGRESERRRACFSPHRSREKFAWSAP